MRDEITKGILLNIGSMVLAWVVIIYAIWLLPLLGTAFWLLQLGVFMTASSKKKELLKDMVKMYPTYMVTSFSFVLGQALYPIVYWLPIPREKAIWFYTEIKDEIKDEWCDSWIYKLVYNKCLPQNKWRLFMVHWYFEGRRNPMSGLQTYVLTANGKSEKFEVVDSKEIDGGTIESQGIGSRSTGYFHDRDTINDIEWPTIGYISKKWFIVTGYGSTSGKQTTSIDNRWEANFRKLKG